MKKQRQPSRKEAIARALAVRDPKLSGQKKAIAAFVGKKSTGGQLQMEISNAMARANAAKLLRETGRRVHPGIYGRRK